MSMNKFRTGIEASNIWDKLDKDNFADPNENYHVLETDIIKQRLKHLPTKKSNIRNINTKNQDGLLMENPFNCILR